MKDTVLTVLGIFSLILVIGLLFALVIHCENDNQLIKIKQSGNYEIYYDKETKVEYIKEIGKDGGLSVRFDKDGKPMLYNEKKERS